MAGCRRLPWIYRPLITMLISTHLKGLIDSTRTMINDSQPDPASIGADYIVHTRERGNSSATLIQAEYPRNPGTATAPSRYGSGFSAFPSPS
jgi:hypothetical protein